MMVFGKHYPTDDDVAHVTQSLSSVTLLPNLETLSVSLGVLPNHFNFPGGDKLLKMYINAFRAFVDDPKRGVEGASEVHTPLRYAAFDVHAWDDGLNLIEHARITINRVGEHSSSVATWLTSRLLRRT